jgi:hypothetical protein
MQFVIYPKNEGIIKMRLWIGGIFQPTIYVWKRESLLEYKFI